MRIEGLENIFKTPQHLTSQLNEINKKATLACRQLAEQQLEILSDQISQVSNQIKRLSNAKNPTEFLTTQKECITENINSTVKNMQKVLTTSFESLQQMTKNSDTLRQTTMKMKTKTKKTKKRTK